MKTLLYFSLALCLCFAPQLSSGQAKTLTPEALQHDFEIFRGALEEMHPGLYWYTPKAEMDQLFDQIELAIQHEMTDLEFFRLLARVISKIRCVHTWIAPPKLLSDHILRVGPLLPIEIKVLGGQAYFYKSKTAQELPIKPGDRILNINGFPIDSLIKLSDEVQSGDGFIPNSKTKLMERYLSYFYVVHIGQPTSYTLIYEDADAQRRETEVKAIPRSEFNPEPKAKETAFIQTRFLQEGTALLTISQFDNWKEGGRKKKFMKVLQASFERIDSARSANLIIDLRDNWGGTETFGMALCAYLAKEPFYGYKQIRFKNTRFKYRKYTNTSGFALFVYKTLLHHKKVNDTTYLLKTSDALKLVKPLEPHFDGKVYVLINSTSYSTTADFAALMHSKQLATFVGLETGGGYQGNSSDFEFELVLPKSKVRFNSPIAQYLTNITPTAQNYGRGTIPDHQIEPTIDDVLQGRDTELEYVLRLIEQD